MAGLNFVVIFPCYRKMIIGALLDCILRQFHCSYIYARGDQVGPTQGVIKLVLPSGEQVSPTQGVIKLVLPRG